MTHEERLAAPQPELDSRLRGRIIDRFLDDGKKDLGRGEVGWWHEHLRRSQLAFSAAARWIAAYRGALKAGCAAATVEASEAIRRSGTSRVSTG